MTGGPLGARQERWCNWKWMAVLVLIYKSSEELDSQSAKVLASLYFTFTCSSTVKRRKYLVRQCAC